MASKSGREILAASRAAATSADSVHVISNASQGPLLFTSDLELARNDGRAKVSLLGIDYEAVRIGQTVYVKGNRAFYAHLFGPAKHVPLGTWLKGSANSGKLSQLAALTSLPDALNRALSTPGSVIKGASTTVNGQKAIELKEATKIYKGVLYVATTGKSYPVVLAKTGGREKGRTLFSAWNEDVSLSAPSSSVDVNSIKG